MISNRFKMRAKVWCYSGVGGWHFVTLPKKQAETIRKAFSAMKRGWGSLPVLATIGQTHWQTSIFPDVKLGSYVLPLKAAVRKKEKVAEGETITFSIEFRL